MRFGRGSYKIWKSFLWDLKEFLMRFGRVFLWDSHDVLIKLSWIHGVPEKFTQIMALEMVQKKFTKRIPNLSDLNYNDRLHSLKLQSLEHRRLIYDLVLCYKIVHNNSCMTFTDLFKFPNINSPRRHSLHLYCPVLKSNLHKGSFAYRVISPWNSLPENIVCAPNSITFKNRLSKFDLSKFLIFPCIV